MYTEAELSVQPAHRPALTLRDKTAQVLVALARLVFDTACARAVALLALLAAVCG